MHPRFNQPPQPEEAESEALPFYNTFALKDGHVLAEELRRYEIPFEVEFDDGISRVNPHFGSGGHEATMSLYIADQHRPILDDLVKLHFHQ
ncbi:MAG: hypothetical protein ACOCVG_01210 [Verrucomicrobiota bacterium]